MSQVESETELEFLIVKLSQNHYILDSLILLVVGVKLNGRVNIVNFDKISILIFAVG
jgi:hypothetical protein